VNGFVDHFYTPLGTTSNYSATTNLHNSQLTIAPAKVFQTAVPWQRLLTVEILQLHALTSFLRRLRFRTACQPFPRLNWIAISSQRPLQSSAALLIRYVAHRLAAISHHPPHLPFTAELSTEHCQISTLFFYNHFARTETTSLLLLVNSLQRERVYRAVA
jgi:hypothetical protein